MTPYGDGLQALLTAANQSSNRSNQTQVRVKAPVPDLACNETLPSVDAELRNAALTKARLLKLVTTETTDGSPTLTSDGCSYYADPARVDGFYWEKHAILTTMLNGFVGMMVRKFEQINAEKPPEKRRILVISNVYHETRADVPRGKLKTIGDLQHLDRLIADMLATHTRVVTHVTQKRRFEGCDATAVTTEAKRVKV
jgi:hypothetical protein